MKRLPASARLAFLALAVATVRLRLAKGGLHVEIDIGLRRMRKVVGFARRLRRLRMLRRLAMLSAFAASAAAAPPTAAACLVSLAVLRLLRGRSRELGLNIGPAGVRGIFLLFALFLLDNVGEYFLLLLDERRGRRCQRGRRHGD